MSSAKLSILRKAGQLLRFQYDIENENNETGKRLIGILPQSLRTIISQSEWVHTTRLIELAPQETLDDNAFGFQYSFKLPSDCEKELGLYYFYCEKGNYAPTTSRNYILYGIPAIYGYPNYDNVFSLFSIGGYFNNYSRYSATYFGKFKRVGNTILTNVNRLLIEYISNSEDVLDHINEYWFIELIAYQLAIDAGSIYLNNTDLLQLKQEFRQIILPNCINKNCELKDKYNTNHSKGIYPYSNDMNFY